MSGPGETVREELVLLERHMEVGLVVLNRPQKLNAFAGEVSRVAKEASEKPGLGSKSGVLGERRFTSSASMRSRWKERKSRRRWQ